MNPRHALLLTLALGSLGSALRADGLADLQAALSRLQTRVPGRAEVELFLWKRKADGGPTVLTQGSASVGVEDGQGGLTLRYSPSLMEGVRREALDKVRNPDAPTPKSDAVEELKARRMAEYLSFAPVMQRDLEQCKLLGEESVTLHGKPARMLRFSANPSLPASIKKLLDRLDTDVRIWIGTDGTPLASEVNYTYKGSRFFMSFSGSHRERLDFMVRQQNLLVSLRDWAEDYQGFGQKSETHLLYKVTAN